MKSHSCPYCGSFENYHKVTSLLDSEISSINTQTKGVAVGVSSSGLGIGAAKANTQGTIQSNLAQKLQPPVAPTQFLCGCGVFGAVLTGIIGLGLSALLFTGTERGLFAWIAIIISFLVGIYFIVFREGIAQNEADELAQHQIAVEEWEKQWYCKKCGEVSKLTNHVASQTSSDPNQRYDLT